MFHNTVNVSNHEKKKIGVCAFEGKKCVHITRSILK